VEAHGDLARCVGICYLDGVDVATTLVRQALARDPEGPVRASRALPDGYLILLI
jgi:endonuclease YncB( thermonuclease family)